MAVIVTDPDVALDGLFPGGPVVGDGPGRMVPGPAATRGAERAHRPRAYPQGRWVGSACLSTDPLAGDNVSHPRTSVRCEGR